MTDLDCRPCPVPHFALVKLVAMAEFHASFFPSVAKEQFERSAAIEAGKKALADCGKATP